MNNIAWAIALMMVAGTFGGAVNVLMQTTGKVKAREWVTGIASGTAAVFLVPLFLKLSTSQLLVDLLAGKDAAINGFVYFAFCLVAAVSSKKFIETLSEKILKQTEEVRVIAEAAKADSGRALTSSTTAEVTALAAQDASSYRPERQPPATAVEVDVGQLPTPGPDLDDPWKGQFGGQSTANGRRLTAAVHPMSSRPGWCAVELAVESTAGAANPLEGTVQFFLHSTFPSPTPVVKVEKGKARINITAWGAFVVGAIADGGGTRLELDLAALPDAPEQFRSR